MADEIDVANGYADEERERASALIRAKAAKLEVEETGFCLSCEKKTPKGRRWCNSDCRDDWEKTQK
jgi:hypothetical protein